MAWVIIAKTASFESELKTMGVQVERKAKDPAIKPKPIALEAKSMRGAKKLASWIRRNQSAIDAKDVSVSANLTEYFFDIRTESFSDWYSEANVKAQ